MCLVTGKSKRAIEDHFDYNTLLENHVEGTNRAEPLQGLNRLIENCSFTYTRQLKPLGLGHAVRVGRSLIGDEPFGLVLSDDFCVSRKSGVMSQLVDLFKAEQCTIVAAERVSQERVSSYGVIRGNESSENVFEVEQLVEKPRVETAPSNIAVVGRYILTPEIFAALEHIHRGVGNEFQLTDALAEVARKHRVLAYLYEGQRFDCGSLDGYITASNHAYRARFGALPTA